MKDSVKTLVEEKANRILKELKDGNKLYAIKELKPNQYSVDQALILDPKEFSKDEIVKLFQLSIALNKGLVQL
jgi:intein/homing endonuclease